MTLRIVTLRARTIRLVHPCAVPVDEKAIGIPGASLSLWSRLHRCFVPRLLMASLNAFLTTFLTVCFTFLSANTSSPVRATTFFTALFTCASSGGNSAASTLAAFFLIFRCQLLLMIAILRSPISLKRCNQPAHDTRIANNQTQLTSGVEFQLLRKLWLPTNA